MSLRDASTNCLVTVVIQFGNLDYDDYAYRTVVIDCILQEVKTGLHNRLEVRSQSDIILVVSPYSFGSDTGCQCRGCEFESQLG